MNKKIFSLPVLIVLGLVVVSAAVVGIYYYEISTTLTVNEAFSSTTTDLTFTGFPDGLEVCQNIAIDNDATVPLNAQLTWIQIDNVDDVDYTTHLPRVISIASGTADYPVCFTTNLGSAAGVVNGNVAITRVA